MHVTCLKQIVAMHMVSTLSHDLKKLLYLKKHTVINVISGVIILMISGDKM